MIFLFLFLSFLFFTFPTSDSCLVQEQPDHVDDFMISTTGLRLDFMQRDRVLSEQSFIIVHKNTRLVP